MIKEKTKILFVCSAGGHLAQILELEELRLNYDYLIVTEKLETTIPLSLFYNLKYLRPDAQRRTFKFWKNFILNFFISAKVLINFNPKVIITTGSHTAIPMCLIAKLFRKKVIWILSYARINSKAKSADIIYPFADLFIVQWESAQKLYPKSKFLGGIY